ncbi:MAG: hypothetical protein RLZZ350_656 [Verrucomicrobiota bacterium]
MGRVRETGTYSLATKNNLLPTFGAGGKPAEAQPPAPVLNTVKTPSLFAGAAQAELTLATERAEAVEVAAARPLPKMPPGSTIPAKRYVRPTAAPDPLGQKAWGLLGARLFGGAALKR